MKEGPSSAAAVGLFASAAFAGADYSGKEMKQVAPPPCPEWYANNEFNVSLWGTYIFTGTNWGDDRYIGPTTLGAVAEISNTSSCVTSASELKDGQQVPDKRDKVPSSISATGFLRVTRGARATPSVLRWAR